MEAKEVVAKEVARQAKFGMEPSWEDFVIAGQKAEQERMTEALRELLQEGWTLANVIEAEDICGISP